MQRSKWNVIANCIVSDGCFWTTVTLYNSTTQYDNNFAFLSTDRSDLFYFILESLEKRTPVLLIIPTIKLFYLVCHMTWCMWHKVYFLFSSLPLKLTQSVLKRSSSRCIRYTF